MLQTSMNELTTLRWSFEEDVVEYAQAGFDGIGIWRSKLTDVGEEAAVELLARNGLACSNLLWAGGFTGSEGFSYRDSVYDAFEAIKTAARLNCKCLVLYSGSWNGHTQKHAHRLVSNALRQLVPFAEEFGVALALEPMHPGCGGDWTFVETLEATMDLIDPFESPCLKVVLDTYHFGLSDPSYSLLEDIAHRIAIVHLGDALEMPSGEQNRCQLGHGMIPNERILNTLISAGYDGFLDIELMGEAVESFDYPTIVREAKAYLDALLIAT